MRTLPILPLLLLTMLCACVRETAAVPETDPLYRERVAAPRLKNQLEKRELVLAQVDSDAADEEVKQLRTVLEKENLRLKVFRVSRREKLPALLRGGHADVIAGKFTPSEIRRFQLSPVLPYAENHCCFAVRNSDDLLKNILGGVIPEESARKGTENERNLPVSASK